jgi:hypothetical protein
LFAWGFERIFYFLLFIFHDFSKYIAVSKFKVASVLIPTVTGEQRYRHRGTALVPLPPFQSAVATVPSVVSHGGRDNFS